jgi:tetratricopeptide (TPR) repeat protein/DNA-binding winged helix-turn-helix (wHTH) protein
MKAPDIVGYKFSKEYYADAINRCVVRDRHPLPRPLTPKEFEVLIFFLERPHITIKREEIAPLHEVSRAGPRHPADDYIKELRSKLDMPELFATVPKAGYMLNSVVRPVTGVDLSKAGEFLGAAAMHFNEHTMISMKAAVQDCLNAIRLDPHCSPRVYIILAYANINLGHVGYCGDLPANTFPNAKQAAETALAEQPDSAEALGILGLIALIWEYDWTKAEKFLSKALQFDPEEASMLLTLAHLKVTQGQTQEAIDYIERAVRSDPLDKIVYSSRGWIYMLAGDINKAKELMDESTSRFPEFARGHFLRALVCEALKDYAEALKSFETALKLEEMAVALAGLGHLHGLMGKRNLAISALERLVELHNKGEIAYLSGYCQALIHVSLGETDECIKGLERAYEERCDWLMHLGVEPRWAPVRSHPRFKDLMHNVGITHLTEFPR